MVNKRGQQMHSMLLVGCTKWFEALKLFANYIPSRNLLFCSYHIESVDSVSRDDPDMPYKVNEPVMKQFQLWNSEL